MFEFYVKTGGFMAKESFDPHETCSWPEKAKIRDKRNPHFTSNIRLSDNTVYLENWGLQYNLKDFLQIIDDPASTCIELVKASSNCLMATDDDYDAERYATDHKLMCRSIILKKPKGEILYLVIKPYQKNFIPYDMDFV